MPWWMAQVEARLGDTQERYAAIAQAGFPFLVMCNVPDRELSEPPTPLPDAGSSSPPPRLLSCSPLLGVAGRGPEWFGIARPQPWQWEPQFSHLVRIWRGMNRLQGA